tara:strand:+ start:570 stop:911 length:342 start_codon:yes stop_codon:yes gene_type:complete
MPENYMGEICLNCQEYGEVENNEIIIPCCECARKNGYDWNGKKCYGATGRSNYQEATLEELLMAYIENVRPRFLGDTLEILGITDRTVDEYILDEFIPDEGKDLYKQLIENYS